MTTSAIVELLMLLAVIVLAIAAGLLLGLVVRRRARAPGLASEPAPPGSSGRPRPDAPPVAPAGPRTSSPATSIRRTRSAPPRASSTVATASATAASTPSSSAPPSSPGTSSSALIAVGASERVCPSCRTTYQDMVYCQRDARRLVSPEDLAAPGRAVGLSCPRCGRSYEHGLRRCPHDGVELVPPAMYQATRRRRPSGPTGVLAKVCPVCRRRFDLSSRFCGRDGHELVVIN